MMDKKDIPYYNLLGLSNLYLKLTACVVVCLTASTIFFGYKYYVSVTNRSEFLVTNVGTYKIFRLNKTDSVSREDYELKNFSAYFLRNLLENSPMTRRKNIEGVLHFNTGDPKVESFILTKFSEKNLNFLATQNAYDWVEIEKINIGTDSYPYDAVVDYIHQITYPESPYKPSKLYGKMILKIKCVERNENNPYGMQVVDLMWGERNPKELEKEKKAAKKAQIQQEKEDEQG